MDDSERYDSTDAAGRPADGRDGASGPADGTPSGPAGPAAPTSPFGTTSPGWNAPSAGAFDAFAAGAPGASRGSRRRPGTDGPAARATPTGAGGVPAAPVGADPADRLGLAAARGAVARLAGADSFDAFGTRPKDPTSSSGASQGTPRNAPAGGGDSAGGGISGDGVSGDGISGDGAAAGPSPAEGSLPGASVSGTAGPVPSDGAAAAEGIPGAPDEATPGTSAGRDGTSAAGAASFFGGAAAGERGEAGEWSAFAPRHGRHAASPETADDDLSDAPAEADDDPLGDSAELTVFGVASAPAADEPAGSGAEDGADPGGDLSADDADLFGGASPTPSPAADAPATAPFSGAGQVAAAEPFDAFGTGSPAARRPNAPMPEGRSAALPGQELVPLFGGDQRPAATAPAEPAADDGTALPAAGSDADGPVPASDAGTGQALVPFFGSSQDAGLGADPAGDRNTAADSAFDAFGTGRPTPVRPSGLGPAADSFDAFAAGAHRPGDTSSLPAVRPDRTPSLFDSAAPAQRPHRPAREPLELEPARGSGSRIARVVTGEYLLTVNPADGTEVGPCPPEERLTPLRRTRQERAARSAAARPTPPPGPPGPELPLLERDEEQERLVRLLGRGRSVRVTGPSGAGRTALLESVATAGEGLAPDGVLWLSGYRRTLADLLQDLWSLVYSGDGYRPAREEIPGLLREVGAVVVVDDLEFGGTAVDELLAAAPECAFLMAATPDVPAPTADALVEEVFLSGLTRTACTELLQLATGRPLEEDEAAWAADLWFESEGLPLRFVQAAALLRQRDALRRPPQPDAQDGGDGEDGGDSVWQKGAPAGPSLPDLTPFDGPAATSEPTVPPRAREARPGPWLPASAVPLPSLAQSAAPAELLASRLSEPAREALAFAVALDGEFPHPAHLPALVGDTHGDAALGELTSVGLAVPVGTHFRLAAGVAAQLAGSFGAEGELTDVQAHTAALHYAWWTGHPSVTPERAAAECEAIIAAMAACRDGGHASAAVLLARTVAPAFAAALHWGAWERTLRIGQEAARLSGEVAEEAYFLHELGVLMLCTGHPAQARAELEASIALRAALADHKGTAIGRRALAFVDEIAPEPTSPPAAPEPPGDPAEPFPALRESSFAPTPPLALPADHLAEALAAFPEPASPATAPLPAAEPVLLAKKNGGAADGRGPRRLAVLGSRRTLVAAGTGVVLVAVLGTIVTLGTHSGGGSQDNQVQPIESVQQDPPADGSTSPATSDAPATTSASASTSTSPSASGSASTTPSGTASPSASGARATGASTSTSPSSKPTTSHSHRPSTPTTHSSSPTPSTTSSTPTTTPSTTPSTTDTATPPGSESSSTATATGTAVDTAPETATAPVPSAS
jgi:hypothetical protein